MRIRKFNSRQERVLEHAPIVQTLSQKQKQDIGLAENGKMKINEVVGITEEEFQKLAEKKDVQIKVKPKIQSLVRPKKKKNWCPSKCSQKRCGQLG